MDLQETGHANNVRRDLKPAGSEEDEDGCLFQNKGQGSGCSSLTVPQNVLGWSAYIQLCCLDFRGVTVNSWRSGKKTLPYVHTSQLAAGDLVNREFYLKTDQTLSVSVTSCVQFGTASLSH